MRLSTIVLVFVINLVATSASTAQAVEPTFGEIPWIRQARPPFTVQLGTEASLRLPLGCIFTGQDGIRDFMELNENPVHGGEMGAVVCQDESNPEPVIYYFLFSYTASGYVSNDKRHRLDADAILRSIRSGSTAANDERRRRGWRTLSIEEVTLGPQYDAATNNLTWALTVVGEDGSRAVNQTVRKFGRGGVMSIELVTPTSHISGARAMFRTILGSFRYLPGRRYGDWRTGDKVATSGLSSLLGRSSDGGSAKMGAFAKFGKHVGTVAQKCNPDARVSDGGIVATYRKGTIPQPKSDLLPATGGVFNVDQVDCEAKYQGGPEPRYPPGLKAGGVEGVVTLEFVVSAEGRVEGGSIGVIHSTDKAFDEPAIEAVRESMFRPAKARGSPVRQLLRESVRFTIQ